MSITEAPDMTVASSSPWRCCGRQRKTSLGETGDTKEEYDMRSTKKRREGGLQETCLCRYRQWKVCVREGGCVDGVTIYSGAGCQRVQVNGPPNPGQGLRQSLQMFGSSAALTHLIQQLSP